MHSDDLTTPLCAPSGTYTRGETEESSRSEIDIQRESPMDATLESSNLRAAYAMMFAVLVDAMGIMCIAPNVPVMVTPGLHDESFPSTVPFDIATAQYARDAVEALGMVISNVIFGYIADRFGSRWAILLLMFGSTLSLIGIFLTRSSYWPFIIMSFVNGLFGSAAAVGNGFMFIIFTKDREKADEFGGYTMATMMIGLTAGGLLTLFFPSSLFLPLIPAAALNLLAGIICFIFVFEPKKNIESAAENVDETKDDSEIQVDTAVCANIITGAFFDHLGTLGVYPLAFSPVMYQRFFLEFENAGKEPIASHSAYRWLFSMIGLAAVPSALMMPIVNKRKGIAFSCIASNLVTAGAIIGLIFTAAIEPPTHASFVLFAVIIFVTFPIVLLSQLSAGAMLDRVTPHDKKSLAQGINNSLYDFSTMFTILFGYISDSKGYDYALWVCFGLTIIGTVVNAPLLFNLRLGKQRE